MICPRCADEQIEVVTTEPDKASPYPACRIIPRVTAFGDNGGYTKLFNR